VANGLRAASANRLGERPGLAVDAGWRVVMVADQMGSTSVSVGGEKGVAGLRNLSLRRSQFSIDALWTMAILPD